MPMRLSPKKLHKLHKDYNKLEIKKKCCLIENWWWLYYFYWQCYKISSLLLQQRKVCASLQKFTTSSKTRIKSLKRTSCIRIWSINMAKTIHRIYYTKNNRSRKKWWQRWKSILQINKQCPVQQNNEKLENKSWHKAVNGHKNQVN